MARPFVVERFGGLNLLTDPQEIPPTEATAMSNVDLDFPGRIRGRYGYSLRSSTAGTIAPSAMGYYKTGANEYVLATTNTAETTPYDLSTGTAGTATATAATSNNGIVRYGDTSNTRVYLADGTTTLKRLTGTTWANVVVTFAAEHLAVMSTSNRLVAASGVRVAFSDPGTPETFGANNYVDLDPGDGETITALVAWRDMVLAFKQTKFYVFYGTSIDSSGNPIFNYRSVTAGHGCATTGAAVAGEDGVYFVDRLGVYITAAGSPQLVSRRIDPWLRYTTFTDLPTMDLKYAVPVYHNRRLYVTDTNAKTTIVYDTTLDVWMVWSIDATGMVSVPTSSAYQAIHFGVSATKKIAYIAQGSQDNGATVSWSYTSGAYDISGENRVAVTLESALWGTGSATLQVAVDHGSFDTGSSLTLGSSPPIAQAFQQLDREGTFWQHKISGTGQSIVNRLAHYVSFVKPAGIQ